MDTGVRDINNTSSTRDAGRIALVTGAAACIGIAIFHVVAGTPEVMHPVYASDLPPEAASVLDVLWHQMTAVVAGAALSMFVAAFRQSWRWPVAWIVGGHFLVVSAVCVLLGFVWFGDPMRLPQWAFFVPVGLLVFWAASRPSAAA